MFTDELARGVYQDNFRGRAKGLKGLIYGCCGEEFAM